MGTERTGAIYTHTTSYSELMLNYLRTASDNTGIQISIINVAPPQEEERQAYDRILLPGNSSPVSVEHVSLTVYGNHVTLFQEMYRLAENAMPLQKQEQKVAPY